MEMSRPYRILHVEDLPSDAYLVEREIRKVLDNCEIKLVETKVSFSIALKEFKPDIILSDISLLDFDWLTAFRLTSEQSPLTPFIIVTGSTDIDYASECMKAGVMDFVSKENIQKLGPSVLHALEQNKIN
jgi:DNA-binding NtrC family response regulator